MDGRVQAKVALAERVLGFLRAKPAWQGSFGSSPAVLEELLARAAMLEARQRDGAVAEREAMAERKVILDSLQRMLGYLSRFATVVTPSQDIELHARCVSDEACLVTARAALERVEPKLALLVSRGMSETLPQLLTTAIARLEAVIEAGMRGYRQQGEARAELWAVAARICSEVRTIDGMVRYRVWGDPAGRESWERVMSGHGWFTSRQRDGDVAPAA